MVGIVAACAAVGGTGLLIGLLLGLADTKLKVEENETEAAVRACLPGNNCGGCGYAGCDGLAAAIAKGEAQPNACPVGGAETAEKIGEILGVDAGTVVRQAAFVKCSGNCANARENYAYIGEKNCKMMPYVPGAGAKTCSYGCMGYGSCVKVCPEGAIQVVDGIAVVDQEKCIACGKCVDTCPKHLIVLVPYTARVRVQCNSGSKGKDVIKACDVGCIGCKKCERSCRFGAITVTDNLAVIDYDKCKNCGLCAKECPRGIISIRPKDN